jgi:hypothetical protein
MNKIILRVLIKNSFVDNYLKQKIYYSEIMHKQ